MRSKSDGSTALQRCSQGFQQWPLSSWRVVRETALICLRGWQMNLEETLLRWDLLFSPEHLSDNSRVPPAEKKKTEMERILEILTTERKDIYSMNLLMSLLYAVKWQQMKEEEGGRPEARPPSKWSSFMGLNAAYNIIWMNQPAGLTCLRNARTRAHTHTCSHT